MNVTFKNLGFDIYINRVAFSIFGYDIYWYGILIGFGIILAVLYAINTCKNYNVNKDTILDLTIISIIFSIIGARLYYVIFSFDNFKYDYLSIFKIRNGGMAIYGGLIFGFISIYVYCRLKNISFLDVLDIYAVPLLIGQCIGRWGNFFNQEAFGKNTNSLFSMYSKSTRDYLLLNRDNLLKQGIEVDPYVGVHPTFLYESFWCFLGILIIIFLKKYFKNKGETIAFYCIWYGFGRFFIENLRTDSLMLLDIIRVSQVVSILFIVFGIFIFLRRVKK